MLILTLEYGKAIYIADMKLTVFPRTDSKGNVEVDYYLTFPESSLSEPCINTLDIDINSDPDIDLTDALQQIVDQN